jgi:conjugal transfer pilin signal peptidase TrbI
MSILENTRNRFLLLGLVITLGYYCFQFLFSHLNVVTSPSIDHRLFINNMGDLEKNAYVRFSIISPFLPDDAKLITKRLSCFQGDELTTVGRSHYCNGKFLGTAKEITVKGEALPIFTFNGVIPQGHAYAHGTHEDSYDSRYWGFLDLGREDIIPVTPVWGF